MTAGGTSARQRRPRGFIFDLDGTLVDSFADIAAALNHTRARYDLPPLQLSAVREKVGQGSAYLVRELVPVAPPAREEALGHYLARYEETALRQTRPLPGVLEVLDRFADRPLAVVTNKTQRLTRAILSGLGLWEHFRIVLGGDALPRSKPDPLPVRRVLECFALPAEAVVLVGDGVPDIAAGRAAGVTTVAVTTGVEPRAVLEAAGADHIVEGLADLMRLYA